MRIAYTGTREHHVVRVKGRAGDGGGPRGGQEGRPRLHGVQEGAVDVEDREGVAVGTTIQGQLRI